MPSDYWYSMEKMEHRVIWLLGGKAATEVISGKVDVGATDDVRRAFNIVGRFADDYCCFGFNSFTSYDSSSYIMKNRDHLRVDEMEKYYRIAKSMIIDYRAFVDALVTALMERKTLTNKNIRAIRKIVLGR